MAGPVDIVIFGTGSFAARILFDLAATSRIKLRVAVIGRNADRLAWLRTGAAARAAMFGSPVEIDDHRLETFTTERVATLLGTVRPRVVVNTASVQGGRRVSERPDAWTNLLREAGLGISTVLQARISLDIARAVTAAGAGLSFVNCCYPDVVNPMIAAAGLTVTCGIGNVAILAHAFAGALGPGHPTLHILAQHAALSAFRQPAVERAGPAPLRVWFDGVEIEDVFARFARVKLAPEPVIDVSGASGIPLFLAMIAKAPWNGHLPGPNGLPGGYPVRLEDGAIRLALPEGLSADQAIAWNTAFEQKSGVIVGADGRVRYTGKVESALRSVSEDMAAGFAMADIDAAFAAFWGLRERLTAMI